MFAPIMSGNYCEGSRGRSHGHFFLPTQALFAALAPVRYGISSLAPHYLSLLWSCKCSVTWLALLNLAYIKLLEDIDAADERWESGVISFTTATRLGMSPSCLMPCLVLL